MKKQFKISLLAFIVLFSTACSSVKPVSTLAGNDVWVESRGGKIPATWLQPESSDPTPLVLLVHGHGGTRHEAGGFTRVAQALGEQGIASIRMDFPGCGDSTEPFSHNNLSNMMLDVIAAKTYAMTQGNIDASRVAMLGFSMGGRLAMLLTEGNQDYAALAMWAPAGINGAGDMVKYLGGPRRYEEMKTQARNEGYAPFTTFWGQKQQLGLQWFLDMETSKPLDAIYEYTGDVFVLYGDQDDVVPPRVSELVITNAKKAATVKRYVVKGADHGLGLFNNDHESSRQAVDETVRFLVGVLNGGG